MGAIAKRDPEPEATRLVELPTAQDPVSLEAVLARAIADPNTDIERLSRVIDVYERLTGRNAEVAYTVAFKAAQEAMPAVVRDAENDQTKSRYAKLETVSDAIDPVIHAHGFTLSFGTDDSPLAGHYRITCKVKHTGGHTEHHFADVPADGVGMKGNQNKTATHAFGSTMSYGRRYLKLLIFDVKLKNQDDDGNRGGGTIDARQVRQLEDLIRDAGADRAAFLGYLRVESLELLPVAKFGAALQALAAKKRAGQAGVRR